MKKDDKGISPVVAVIILVGITVVLAGVLYIWVSNTMQAGGLGKETAPTLIVITKNSSDALKNGTSGYDDQKVATLTLTEGSVLNSEIEIMLSADGDSFDAVGSINQDPNNEPTTHWDAGEAVIIYEGSYEGTDGVSAPENCWVNSDSDIGEINTNWGSNGEYSTDFHIRIIYKPSNKVIYSDHITLEESKTA